MRHLNRVRAPREGKVVCSECGVKMDPGQKCYRSDLICPPCARKLLQGECIHQQTPTSASLPSPSVYTPSEPPVLEEDQATPRCGACGAPLITIYYRKGRGGLGGLEKVGLFCRWCGQPYIKIAPIDETCVKRRLKGAWCGL
jgi:hypothetical protein